MRIPGLFLLLAAMPAANAAKPDPAVYPNANIYRDPAIAKTPQAGYAKVIREFCPGMGRGQIHFLALDGHVIRIRKTWPTYLELAPGQHRIGLEFIGTASDIWSTWNGTVEIPAELEAGKTYLVRYQRTATDAFRAAITAYDGFHGVDHATVVCEQSSFPDTKVHQ